MQYPTRETGRLWPRASFGKRHLFLWTTRQSDLDYGDLRALRARDRARLVSCQSRAAAVGAGQTQIRIQNQNRPYSLSAWVYRIRRPSVSRGIVTLAGIG